MYNSSVHVSTKPTVKIKTVNTIFLVVIALSILVIAIGIFYFLNTKKSEEELPASILSFNINIDSTELAVAGNSNNGLKETSEQDTAKIKKLTESFLNKLFIEKETETEDLKSMFIEVDDRSSDKFTEKILQNDIEEEQSVIIKGEGNLEDLLIAYDKDSKPITAVSHIDIVLKFISKTGKEDNSKERKRYQYDIKLNGIVMFELFGGEWRFSRVELEKDIKKYEVTEK